MKFRADLIKSPMPKQDAFCDVFLSFRGEIRDKFTCFLYEALEAEGFVAFMDKSSIHVGDEVDSSIKKGIRNSRSAIIIFSKKYAESTWCLDELVLILEEKKKCSQYFIIPIFYDVKTKDIKHQLGNYGRALEKHRGRHGDKVEEWRQALVEVGNILGEHVEGLQSTFIRGVVDLFRERLMAAKLPEHPLPTPEISPMKGSSPLQPLTRKSSKDKVILYTTNACHYGPSAKNCLVKKLLAAGNVVFEKRNCSKEPKYLRELEELLGNDKVRFPTVIVNGKDLCGEEQVKGLDDFGYKLQLVAMLKTIYGEQFLDEKVHKVMHKVKDFFS